MQRKTMLAAVLNAPEDMVVKAVAIPEINANEVLIKVVKCGICGTDPHIFKGRFPAPTPLIQGHEFAGEVVEVGSGVTNVPIGARVTADINVSCGTCFYCRNGQKLFCESIRQIGVHMNGAFAEYVKAPAGNIYLIPDGISWEEAAYIEPLACVLRGQERAGITLGSTVAIIGAGPMGLVHALISKLNGASKVIVSELNQVRLQKARDLGVDHVIDANLVDPVQVVRELTDGRGADFVFEVVGAIPTYIQAFDMVRRGGVLVAYGAAPATSSMEIKPFDIYSKELTIVGSYAGTYDTWLKAIQLISNKRFDPTQVISKEIPLASVVDGIHEAIENKDVLKLMVNVQGA